MKTAKLGAMFLVSLMAIAGVGASYAYWAETITMSGTVNTGSFNIEWSLGAIGDTETPGNDFSHVEAVISGDGNTLTVTVVNGYQCIEYYVNFDIHNAGTVPAHLGGFNVVGGNTPADWIWIGGDPSGTYLNPGQSWLGTMSIHIDDAVMNGVYTFTITIPAHQYNDPHTP
ncbi:MAG: hypothetical protein IMZ43_06800 [Thermoplasmata archaeon]|nr:hypothetical protein [Thermoplasmata archaeon]